MLVRIWCSDTLTFYSPLIADEDLFEKGVFTWPESYPECDGNLTRKKTNFVCYQAIKRSAKRCIGVLLDLIQTTGKVNCDAQECMVNCVVQ